jgi:hypothetical protein
MTLEQFTAAAPVGAACVPGADVAATARSFIGTRWEHQGRSRNGVDCLGLVLLVAQQHGLTDFDTRDYARQATDESMLWQCRKLLLPVDVSQGRPGDIPVMRFGTNRHIGVFGDYLYGGLSLIHAFSLAPHRVTEHRFSDEFLRHYDAALIGVFRFPGVTA